jgi:hypothetical protein
MRWTPDLEGDNPARLPIVELDGGRKIAAMPKTQE